MAAFKYAIQWHDIINYNHHAVHFISRTYLFHSWEFVPFDPFRPSRSLAIPCLHQPLICSLYLWALLKIPRISKSYTVLIFLYWIHFTEHNAVRLSPYCHKWKRFIHFWLNNIPFHTRFSLFIHWWTFRLFLLLGYSMGCCSDCGGGCLNYN